MKIIDTLIVFENLVVVTGLGLIIVAFIHHI